MAHPLKSALSGIVGEKYVADSDFAVWTYAKDSSGFPATVPGIIVKPGTTDEVSQIVKLANREKVPIVPRGGGTAYGGTAYSRSPGESSLTICMDLTRMRKILNINEVNRTVTVEAGITCTELETRLRRRGLYVHTVYGPADSVTVGGVVSGVCGGGGGQMFSSSGNNGPYFLGVKAVLPNGDVIETGTRTNAQASMFGRVCHGPDMTGLFIGHMGIFGVTTEVTLQVFDWPPYEGVGGVAYDYENLNEAHKAFTALAAHPARPFSLLGLIGPGPESIMRRIDWAVFYKVHGYSQEEVDSKSEIAYEIIAQTAQPKEWDSDFVRILQKRSLLHPHDVSPRKMGMWSYPEPCCPRDGTLGIVKSTLELMNRELEGWGGRIKSAGSAVWMHGDQDYVSFPLHHKESDPEAREKALDVWKKIIDMALDKGANFLVMDKHIGDMCAARFPPEYHDFLRTIKKSLDPNNIMNPYVLGLSEKE